MPFEKKYLDDSIDIKSLSFSLWLNADRQNKIIEVGLRLRQSKVGTILLQALDIAAAKLRVEEDLTEILLNNERKNKRSGLEELEILEKELRNNLTKL
ncbi:hypothetical protein ES702_02755 [subsurface metagenome]